MCDSTEFFCMKLETCFFLVFLPDSFVMSSKENVNASSADYSVKFTCKFSFSVCLFVYCL